MERNLSKCKKAFRIAKQVYIIGRSLADEEYFLKKYVHSFD